MAQNQQPNNPSPPVVFGSSESAVASAPHLRFQVPEARAKPQPSTAERYPNRYFEGDHVILSLGPQPSLFRIQRDVLAKYSGTFGDMFRLPPPEGSTAEGSSDDNPIRLSDDPDHFAGVLSVYYGAVLMPHPTDLTFEYVTGVLRVAFKYDFALAVEWAWSNIGTNWSWQAEPWLTTLSKPPSQVDIKQAIALIDISHESHDHRFLGSAFYLLCVDEKWSGDESIYGAMQPGDIFLLLKGSRRLSRLWVEKSRVHSTPGLVTTQFSATYDVLGRLVTSPNITPVATQSESDAWLAFIRDPSTMSAVFQVMGLSFPPSTEIVPTSAT